MKQARARGSGSSGGVTAAVPARESCASRAADAPAAVAGLGGGGGAPAPGGRSGRGGRCGDDACMHCRCLNRSRNRRAWPPQPVRYRHRGQASASNSGMGTGVMHAAAAGVGNRAESVMHAVRPRLRRGHASVERPFHSTACSPVSSTDCTSPVVVAALAAAAGVAGERLRGQELMPSTLLAATLPEMLTLC